MRVEDDRWREAGRKRVRRVVDDPESGLDACMVVGLNAKISPGDNMPNQELKHSTLVLERICAAPVERVFAAFANPQERASWGYALRNSRIHL